MQVYRFQTKVHQKSQILIHLLRPFPFLVIRTQQSERQQHQSMLRLGGLPLLLLGGEGVKGPGEMQVMSNGLTSDGGGSGSRGEERMFRKEGL
jgi:hypothetical protein